MDLDHHLRLSTVVFASLFLLSAFAESTAGETVLGFADAQAHANLGVSVDANGDWIVSGAPGYGVTAVEGGAVIVFRRSLGGWIHDRIAEIPVPEAWSRLGFAVGVRD